MKTLYLDCSSGISGDMTVGALLDLGASKEALIQALDSMGIEGYQLKFGRAKKCGIDAYDFDVILNEEGNGCEHEHSSNHDIPHTHEDGHIHKHSHTHNHTHAHTHRNIQDIRAIINRLDANEPVKELASRIFEIVAEAESAAHGIPVEEVHFHEVGAVDSIVDIIGTAICINELGIDQVIVSPLAEGQGYVKCQHGVMPVPVPAVMNIASSHKLTLRMTENEGEMVTPTGAAIAAALQSGKRLPACYTIKKAGIGAGKKEFNNANILRAMIIEPEEENLVDNNDEMWIIESNIDDCSGEVLGFAMEVLLKAGAADVWYSPIYMKKNRPAYQLHVLCHPDLLKKLEELIFIHTTTIGIRRYPVKRSVLERREETVKTSYGLARVKVCTRKDRVFCYPEYESIHQICQETDADFSQVYHEITNQALKQFCSR